MLSLEEGSPTRCSQNRVQKSIRWDVQRSCLRPGLNANANFHRDRCNVCAMIKTLSRAIVFLFVDLALAAAVVAQTPTSSIVEYTIPTANSYPTSITSGPDGNLWFTEMFGHQIGRITPDGLITEFLCRAIRGTSRLDRMATCGLQPGAVRLTLVGSPLTARPTNLPAPVRHPRRSRPGRMATYGLRTGEERSGNQVVIRSDG